MNMRPARPDAVSLCLMTRELCHAFFRDFQYDPATFADVSGFSPFQYSEEWVERYFDAKRAPQRVLFAVMLDGRPIGEVQLKQIDGNKRECALSIHLQNDSVKGKGYGTVAEKLALQYAFDVLKMRAVNADALLRNTRSQHVLEKVGFRFEREENGFRYYRCER